MNPKLHRFHKFLNVKKGINWCDVRRRGDDALVTEVAPPTPAATARDDDAVAAFVERFAGVLADSGMPRMPARVFIALLVTDSGRLTAAELAATLDVSPAAISGAVRYLTQVEMVSRDRDRGSRRDHYRVGDDVWNEMFRKRDLVLGRYEAVAREGLAVVGPGSPAGERLQETIVFFEFLQKELPAMLDRWTAYRDELRANRR
jgi:DNA-binding transcriptional ArsR family regulator